MIDKFDIRVPAGTPFTQKFRAFEAGLRHGVPGPFRSSRFYAFVSDLRKHFLLDAVLHLGCKTSDTHDHKIEIIDAGEKSVEAMLEIITRIFVVDPLTLEIMRVDLTADVFGIPVSWFRQNAQFQFKRFSSRIENTPESELDFIAMGTVEAQSIYAGRRPNCMRIYNKLAELRKQWRKHCRDMKRFLAGMNNEEAKFAFTLEQKYYGTPVLLSFEEFCRVNGYEWHPELIVTRVERQIGGDRVPEEINTIGKLENLKTFNPFAHVRINQAGVAPRPAPENWSGSIRDYLALIGFQQLTREYGNVHNASAFVNRYGKGNGKRVLSALMENCPPESPPISAEQLTEIFHASLERQLPTKRLSEWVPPTYDPYGEIAEEYSRVFSKAGSDWRQDSCQEYDP